MVPMRMTLFAAIVFLAACSSTQEQQVAQYTYEVVHAYPHDTRAFTEGLFYLDGFLYESTGLEFQSSVRKVKIETGEIVQRHDLPQQYFGEGIVNWKDRLIQLTYRTEVGFVYDLATFGVKSEFKYPGEGWALTHDGKRIIMSDGTAELRFWDPETLKETGRVTVTDEGQPVKNVNELEFIKGEIWANIWQTERIARIDPATGKIKGWIDCAGLLSAEDRRRTQVDVMNGIAYDAAQDRVFVTGKYWPKLFEIRVVAKSAGK